jgi:hypothetical protein
MTLPERMVEAAARAIAADRIGDGKEAWNSISASARTRCLADARAALTAALAVAEAEGVVLCKVPEERRFLSGEGEHVDSANAGAAGHNTCRAAILAGRVTL